MSGRIYRAGLRWRRPAGAGHLAVRLDLPPRRRCVPAGPPDADVEMCRICGCSDFAGEACHVCGGSRVHRMDALVFLGRYRDGDERGWAAEFDWLRTHHADRLAQLHAAVSAAGGIVDPVEVGPDGRVWDGHHRLAIAHDLGLQVPFILVGRRP